MGVRELVGLGGLATLFLLISLRIPVALAMFLVGVVGVFALSLFVPFIRFEPYLLQFKSTFWNTVSNYDLSVLPLFLLMGFLAAEIGLNRDLFRGMQALVGRWRGGVAIAVIGACAGFGAVSGSSIATTSTMGKISLPELRKLHYSERLSTGVLAAGGTLGILIPPSIALVIYAVVVEASIIQMFQAAILPAIIAIFLFLLVIIFSVWKNPKLAPKTIKFTLAERKIAIRKLIPIVFLFGMIILGLGFGIFTPTPAASASVFGVLIYGLLLKRKDLSWKKLQNSFQQTAKITAMIYFILFSADVLKGFLSRSGLPSLLSNSLALSGWHPYLILIAMLLFLIFLGFFMESLSMILVIIPFFFPVLVELNGGNFVSASQAIFGMDNDSLKIWFGILALVVVELGLMTPPVGFNFFIIKSLTPHTPSREIFLGIVPFFAIEIFRIFLLVLFPSISLLLPKFLL